MQLKIRLKVTIGLVVRDMQLEFQVCYTKTAQKVETEGRTTRTSKLGMVERIPTSQNVKSD
jgi:hypothetical protein